MSDSLGDRMKANYEDRQRYYLTRRMPVIVRVDGRAFHTYTKGFHRPFDQGLINAMVNTAAEVCREAQGCKLAYIQSDEASFLLTDYDTLTTAAWFDYNKSKVESIAASVMSVAFNRCISRGNGGDELPAAHFDARAFNLPREEVTNYFLWRARDWERNSVAMYCQSAYSHRDLHGKNKGQQHDMLHAAGKNWAKDLSSQVKNGTFLTRFNGDWQPVFIEPSYEAIESLAHTWAYCDKGASDASGND